MGKICKVTVNVREGLFEMCDQSSCKDNKDFSERLNMAEILKMVQIHQDHFDQNSCRCVLVQLGQFERPLI